MNKLLFKLIACKTVLLIAIGSNAQITLKQNYSNSSSASIGTYQGILIREAGFSGLCYIPGTDGKEFWVCSDRGPNIDAASANPSGCRPTYDKIYPFPSYSPKIHRIRVQGDSIQILRTITIKRPSGSNVSGLINPTGLGSTGSEQASTDTVADCNFFSSKIAAKDTFGIDCEGIAVDKNGYFWLSEEGGPTIWKIDQNGRVIKRYTPYYNMGGAQPVDASMDSVFRYRKNNRGFESLSIAPNGKIYSIIQSPLLYPSQAVGENTRIHRILEIDPANDAMRMLVYLNDGIIGSGSNQVRLRDWKIGDMSAINDSTFLVIEAAARGTTDIKRVYLININGATAVSSGLYNNVTLEALSDSAGLAANSIKPVKKTLFMDLLANSWPAAYDKAEGISIINDSTIAICNDNDYSIASPAANGVINSTGVMSHLVIYRLSGSNKLSGYKSIPGSVHQGVTGVSSSQAPYLTPAANGVRFTSLLSAGDAVNGYRMVGLPDGLGAFDNGNGTFTVLMNHEAGNTSGINRSHGTKGAFVSMWVVSKSDFSVLSGSDLIQKVFLWNTLTGSYIGYNSASPMASGLNRFCSADLPAVSAFYNSTSGKGSTERIFMNGEESGTEGRGFAHIVTGQNAGNSYELPALGKFSWENSVANPGTGDKTVVAGTDDATPGQVYFYIGTKTNTGNEIERAGLTNGKLYAPVVNGLLNESSGSIPAAGTSFSMADLGDVKNLTGATLETNSNNAGVTRFLRPEDGAWDPSNPADFYFVTTNAFGSPSRLWKLHFSNINDLTQGGTITAMLDGTEGQQMLDNMSIDQYGYAILQEDIGGNAALGKIWQYNLATDALVQISSHDSTRFKNGAANFLTQDEEASGVIDVQKILGPGMFLMVDQAHYGIAGELIEGGQLLLMFNPASANASPEISLLGNNKVILSGDTTPALDDNTDFGVVNKNKTTSRQFTIANSSSGTLVVSALNIEGLNGEFTLFNPPALPFTVSANSTQILTVRFSPLGTGTRTAALRLRTNDLDEDFYSFKLQGTAVSPSIKVKGNGVDIIPGDLTAGPTNNTDFGMIKVGTVKENSFVIENKGAGSLSISWISVTGANASDFTVIQETNYPISIPAGGSYTFKVRFLPGTVGPRSAMLRIGNDDENLSVYEFALEGISADPTSVKEATQVSLISVFPNPATDKANVRLDLKKTSDVTVKIYDLQGRELISSEWKNLSGGSQELSIATAELKNGVYFLEITAAGDKIKTKLVITQ